MNKLKYKKLNYVKVSDWDELVTSVYGRPYCLQQQNGFMDRDMLHISVPSEDTLDDEMHDSIPEVVNGEEMGVKFDVWLKRDPNKKLKDDDSNYMLELFWHRSFYPDLQTVANDLHKRGIIEEGDYLIHVDW